MHYFTLLMKFNKQQQKRQDNLKLYVIKVVDAELNWQRLKKIVDIKLKRITTNTTNE